MNAAIHLQGTAPLAERVLLPGDPGRALMLAQLLIDGPKMFNHNRGLWGYSGPALADGAPLTIQSTGMGGPSAAIVIAELHDLGARTFVRVGTCGALVDGLALGELVVVSEALCEDGASRALGAGPRVAPSPPVLAALRAAGDASDVVAASADLFYDGPADAAAGWVRAGAGVVELETATLFALAARRGCAAGALLAVSDVLVGGRRRIAPEALRDAEERLGRHAMAALLALSR